VQIWGVTKEELESVIQDVGDFFYGGNVRLEGYAPRPGNSALWHLRYNKPRSKGGKGVRIARNGKTVGSCWHVHRDVMAEIFRRFPNARIKSALADYRSKEDFEQKFSDTYETTYYGMGPWGTTEEFGNSCLCSEEGPRPAFLPLNYSEVV